MLEGAKRRTNACREECRREVVSWRVMITSEPTEDRWPQFIKDCHERSEVRNREGGAFAEHATE